MLTTGTRVLIIGGTGFIGRFLAARCVELGADVTVLSRSTAPRRRVAAGDVLQVDIRQRASVRLAVVGRSYEYVFNLGGYIDHAPYFRGGRDVIDQHLTGLMNVLDAVSGPELHGFVQVGSSDEYGESAAPQGAQIGSTAISPYAFAKRAGCDLVRSLALHEGLPATVARLFLVYGPTQGEQRFLPQIIRSCLRNDSFVVSPGDQTRDFCFIDDVVEGLIQLAVTPGARGQVLNIASGIPVRLRDVVEAVVRLAGGGKPQFGGRPYRAGESMALFADLAKTGAILGWRPLVGLEEGLTRTIGAYRAEMAAPPTRSAHVAVEQQ